MQRNFFLNRYYITLMLLPLCLLPVETIAQNNALLMAESVADRIIKDTAFDFAYSQQKTIQGLEILDFGKMPSVEQNSVSYALSFIKSRQDTVVTIGVSHSQELQVWANDSMIYRSVRLEFATPQEIAYDRFAFQDTIRLTLRKGYTRLLIKTTLSEKPAIVYLGVMDRTGILSRAVSFSLEPLGLAGDSWMFLGPIPSLPMVNASQNLDIPFTVEKNIRPAYEISGRFCHWVMVEKNINPELKIRKDAVYKRDSFLEWHYANGTTLFGLLALARVSGESQYRNYVDSVVTFTLKNLPYFRWQHETLHALRGSYYRLFRSSMLDDTSGPGLPYLDLALQDRKPALDSLVESIAGYVTNRQVRLADGTLCRPEPVAMTVWADDLFMGVPFLLRMGKLTENSKYDNDAALQILNFTRYLRDSKTGLFNHGWFSASGENTTVFWGRANGWVAWTLSEALLLLPSDHPDYKKIQQIYQAFMASVRKFRDKDGMWHQVLDHPESYEETSCTAMFILAMARGVRLGWLPDDYRELAVKSWEALARRIDNNGVVHGTCRGTGIGESLEYYLNRPVFDNDPRGLGAVLVAATEISIMDRK